MKEACLYFIKIHVNFFSISRGKKNGRQNLNSSVIELSTKSTSNEYPVTWQCPSFQKRYWNIITITKFARTTDIVDWNKNLKKHDIAWLKICMPHPTVCCCHNSEVQAHRIFRNCSSNETTTGNLLQSTVCCLLAFKVFDFFSQVLIVAAIGYYIRKEILDQQNALFCLFSYTEQDNY